MGKLKFPQGAVHILFRPQVQQFPSAENPFGSGITRHESQDAFGQQRFFSGGLRTVWPHKALSVMPPMSGGGRNALGHHPVPSPLLTLECYRVQA